MKTSQIKIALIVLASLALPLLAPAANVTLKTADASGTTSFTGSTNWSSGAVPSSGNDYYTVTTVIANQSGMRTPPDAANYTFGGNSLTLSPFPASGYSMIEKSSAASGVGRTLTINNFTNAGGLMRSGGNVGSIITIAGNVFTISANSTITADQCNWIINSPLAGSGIITNNFASAQTLTFGGNNSAFGGKLLINGIVLFSAQNAVPPNPAVAMPDQIILGSGGTLRDNIGITLNNALGGVTLYGAATVNTVNAVTNTIIAEPIAGAFGLTKSGAGILTLSGSNTFSGGLTLSGATVGSQLNINSTNALGTGTFTISGGNVGIFDNTSGSPVTNLANNAQSWANDFTFAGSSSLNLGTGLVTLAANRNVTNLANTLTVGGNIGGAFSLTKAGAGTLALTASNSYTGGTTLSAGTLIMGNTNGLGSSAGVITFPAGSTGTLDIATPGNDTAYNLTSSSSASSSWTLASDVNVPGPGINHTLGTVGLGGLGLTMNVIAGPNVSGGNPSITSGLLTISSGSAGNCTINPTTASISIAGTSVANNTAKTLILGGTSSGNAITAAMTQPTGIISVIKTGTSTWTLSGVSTCTGTTTVSNGNLTVSGQIGSNMVTVAGGTLAFSGSGTLSNGTPVVVASAGTLDVSAASGFALGGSSTLGGSGVVNGNFADSNGSQILPGGSGAIGTLTFNNNLTLAGGDTMQFNFNASSNSVIAVGGNLTPGGTQTTINLASGANGLPNGNYVLFQVTNNLNGSAANFTVTGQPSPSRQTFTVVYNTVTSPKQVLLQVSGSAASLTWNPTTSAWDILTTTNWLNGVVNDYYFDGDNVNFTDSGSSLSPVLNTNVHPGSVTFNSANAYTLSGTGSINGSAGLTKTNTGTLTIQITTNGYTGVTAFNGGVVSISTITNSGIASPIGAASSASGNLAFNGGTLQYTGGTAGTDHGATLNAGGGTVAVSSSATALSLNGVIAGTSGGALTTAGSGTVVLTGANTYNGSTAISGGTLQVGNGGATGNLGSGNTITDNGALVVNRTGTLTLTNVINGTGSVANNNTGTLVLAATNTYTGGTLINTGLVQVVTAGGLGGTPAVFNPAQINIGIGELRASTSFSIGDTNSGVTVAAGTIGVDTNVVLTISNQMVSLTSLTKALPGKLILSGSNTFSGVLNVDTFSTSASDGALDIASTNALGGVPTIQIQNDNAGSSTLQLDGTQGSVNVNPGTFTWNGRNNFIPAIENLTGSNVWDPSTVTMNVGGSYYMFQCDAGILNLAGTFPSTAPTTGRNFSFAGPGQFLVTGSIQTGGCTNLGVFVTNNATVTFWGGNSYSGITSVQVGTLSAADGSSFGTSTENIELAPYTGETATFNISNAQVTAQRVIVAGVTANTGTPGTATVNQENGGTVNASQWVTIGSGGASGGTGTYNLDNGTLNVQNTAGGTQLEVANFAGSVGTLNISGSSSLNIQNSAYIALGANAGAGNGTVNQYGGTVTFSGANGILYLGKATGLASNYIYNLDGGTLTVPTITSSSGNSLFYLNGGTLQATKTNAAFMSGLAAAYVSTNASILDDGGFPVSIPQPLLHDPALGATADGGLTKQNSGTLTLAGTNTYTGPTTVTGGALNINGSIGTGAVTVSSGTLGGAGALNGAVDVQSGGTLAPGAAIGILTFNNSLSFESGSTAQFNFGTGTNSTAVVAGAVNVNGATTVSINYISAVAAFGTYNLIQYGSLTGFANLTPPTSPNPRFTFSLVNTASAKAVQLVVTGNPASLVWHGDGVNNYWDNAGGDQTWFNGASADYFYDGDTVLFNNIGSNTPSIYLTTTLSPASVTVNSSQNYDFAGTGSIAGPGSLTKSGSGILTNEDNNTYVGPTIINAGTLQIGAGATTGTLGAGNVTDNGALVFDRTDTITVANAINGSGSVSQIGGGTLALTTSNNYAGLTVISSGLLLPHDPSALGAAGTIATNGGQLYIDLNYNFPNEALTLGGSALNKGGGGVSTVGGSVTLVANTTIHVDGSATLNLTNAGGISGPGFNLTLTGDGGSAGTVAGPLTLGTGGLTENSSGTWTLGPGNTFTGLTAINAGTLRINDASLGQPAAFTANQITLAGGSLEALTNTSFIDGKAGFTLTANSTLIVDSGATLTISNNISGANNLTKSLAGTLILNGSNAFSGILNVDTDNNAGGNDGFTRIASPNALANVPATPGTPTIFQRNNNSAYSTLQLDGTMGNLTLPQEIQLSCRNVAFANVENLAGSNTISGNVDILQGGGAIYFQSDTNSTLNISGNIQYLGTLVGVRTYNFTGAGNQVVNGVITAGVNAGSTIDVAMSGTGTLTLAGANTYTNGTSVSSGLLLVNGSILGGGGVSVTGGTLGGTGTINDAVSVGTGGTLSPGAGGIGTLTITSNLTLAGTTYIEVSKTGGINDMVVGLTNVTYGGTLFATNLNGIITTNDSFTIFNTAAHSQNFTALTGSPGTGLAWSFNPATGVLGVVSAVPPLSGLRFTGEPVISGTTLTISGTNTGAGTVYLLTTTNLATPISAWTPVWTNQLSGSGSFTNNVLNAVNPALGRQFYLLGNTNN